MKVELHPEAETELYEAAAWYDDQRSGLGDDLLAEITRWLDVLAESPSIWPKWPGAPDLDPPIQRVLTDRFPYAISVVVAPATGLELALKRLRPLQGRTVEAVTGLPVSGAAVYVVDEDRGHCAWQRRWLERVVADSAGRFRFGVLTHRDETRCLAVEADGYATTLTRVGGREDGEELLVPLHTGAEFRATVLDETGRPVPEAAICLAQPDGCWYAGLKADSAGVVTGAGVREGQYRVYIHHEWHGVEVVPLEVRAALSPPTLTLYGSGALTVRVQDAGEQPARKAEIAVLDEEGRDALGLLRALEENGFSVEYVGDGERTYRRLPRGRYRLRAKEWIGDGPFGPEVAVELGREPAEVTLTLP